MFPLFWFLTPVFVPVAQGGSFSGLATTMSTAIKDLIGILGVVGPTVAVGGFVMLGIMYAGGSIPVLKGWKEENPKAFGDALKGILLLILAGGVTGLIGTITIP